jgi:hypothetical protein
MWTTRSGLRESLLVLFPVFISVIAVLNHYTGPVRAISVNPQAATATLVPFPTVTYEFTVVPSNEELDSVRIPADSNILQKASGEEKEQPGNSYLPVVLIAGIWILIVGGFLIFQVFAR